MRSWIRSTCPARRESIEIKAMFASKGVLPSIDPNTKKNIMEESLKLIVASTVQRDWISPEKWMRREGRG